MSKSLLFLSFLLICACAQKTTRASLRGIASLQSSAEIEGVWDLQGSNSVRGPYTGELELRRSHDGTYNVTRVLTYISYYYEGLRVQEIWTGKAVSGVDNLVVTYDLKGADFITSFNGVKREADDFKTKATINAFFLLTRANTLQANFVDRSGANYQEWLTVRRNLDGKSLWSEQRTPQVLSGARPVPANIRAEIHAAKARTGYDRTDLAKASSRKPEYKNGQPIRIEELTDSDFYKKNNDFLRIENKPIDSISLEEAFLRRNAYTLTLSQKQNGYDKNLQERHMSEYGLVMDASFDDKAQFLGLSSSDETPLTTGMYITSQALRYLKTKDSEALENVRRSLKGLALLMEISGDPKILAAAVEKYDATKESPWKKGEGAYIDISWRQAVSDKAAQGILQGLVWASMVTPTQDLESWKILREKTKQLLNVDVIKNSTEKNRVALGLSAYVNRDQTLLSQYQSLYAAKQKKAVPSASDAWYGSADWVQLQKIFLDKANEVSVANLLGLTSLRDQLRQDLVNRWLAYVPVQTPLMTLMSYAVSGSSMNLGGVQMQAALQKIPSRLKEVPFPRPRGDISYDHSKNNEWSLSPVPKMFWQTAGKKNSASDSIQGLDIYPAFEALAIDGRGFWEDPFSYQGSSSKNLEISGTDYLLTYWLAQYVGIADEAR